MKKSLFVSFLFAAVVTVTFAQTTAREWFDKAGEYFDNGDYNNAIKAYSEVIKRDNSNINAYWFRGVSYIQIKNYDACISDCDFVIKNAPDFPRVYIVRGDAYGFGKSIYHKAVADYKKGLELGYEPNDFNVEKSSKADMWFCGGIYMEIAVNRFLNNTANVTKYENFLKTVCDKNNVTRAEVEAYYKDGIGKLISDVVDEEFNKVSFFIANTIRNQDSSYGGVLTRDTQNGQYTLSYEGYFDGKKQKKTLSAKTPEALSSALSASGDFSQAAIDTVKAQAALVPAVIYEKYNYTTLVSVKNIITDFYINPTSGNYERLLGLNNVFRVTRGDESLEYAYESLIKTLVALNPALAKKIDPGIIIW